MSKSTFRILFYLRKNYLNKSGKAGIMVRLTVNGDMVERKAETQTSTGVSADKTAIVEAEQEKKPKRNPRETQELLCLPTLTAVNPPREKD